MLRRIIGLTRCLRGRHERSEKKAVRRGDEYVSVCAHCGVPMRRLAKRRWVVDRGRKHAALDA